VKELRRALAVGAVLGAVLAGCGHYAPPVRPEPADEKDASGSSARSEAEPSEVRKDDRNAP
jgi:hypothetical protein